MAMLEFRLLGPVEVHRDGHVVRFQRQAALKVLTALLLTPGWTVKASTLVDALWPDEPPKTALRQIQNTVALIRRRLGCDDALLTHTRGSYAINVTADQCDTERFKLEVGRADDARTVGRPDIALAHLRRGLALWRGQALAGMTGPYFASAARALDEARLVAIEDSLDLEMSVECDYQRGVEALQRLCAEHPDRPRPVELLMTAQYRLGRIPDALETYRRYQSHLAEELGVDPPRAVHDLHTAILRDDVPLAVGPSEPATAIHLPARPAQLPSAPRIFTGRDVELRRLTEAMSEAAPRRLAAITGLAGVGKTALALAWARGVQDQFPDGQLYIDLRGTSGRDAETPENALTQLLRSLSTGGVPESVDGSSAMYRSLTAGRRMLVVLDNARDAEQVRPLLPGDGANAVLVTSRNRLSGLGARDDAVLIRLRPMQQAEALELVSALVGADTIAADPRSAAQMCARCGGLPLALRIAASRLLDDPGASIAAVADELAGRQLETLTIADDPGAAVRPAFDGSLRLLDPQALDLLLRLGLLPGVGFAHGLAAAVAGVDLDGVTNALRRIENASLLESEGAGRSRFHDLVKTYVDECAQSELDDVTREAVHDGYTDWYYARSGTLPASDFANVVAAVRRWRGHPRALRLAKPLSMFAPLGFDAGVIRAEVESALPAGTDLGDATARYEAHSTRFQVLWAAGRYDTAMEHARKAVVVAESISDVAAASAYGDLGIALYGAGHYREAMEFTERAVVIGRRVGAARLGGDLGCLAHLARAMGDHKQAAALFAEAVDIAERAGNRGDAMECRLGTVLLDLDLEDWVRAEATLAEIERFAEAEGAERFGLLVRRMRGESLRMRGRYAAALRLFEQALAEAEAIQRTGFARRIRLSLAYSLAESGRHEEAQTALDQAFAAIEGRLNPVHQAQRALILCLIHGRAGRHAEAVQHGRRAVGLYRDMPDVIWRRRAQAALDEAQAAATGPRRL